MIIADDCHTHEYSNVVQQYSSAAQDSIPESTAQHINYNAKTEATPIEQRTMQLKTEHL